jgi:c-di-GMP-binding flagellar brake protein YcgR
MSFPPQPRNHPRYPVPKITSYHYDGREFSTLTLDLGLGGMRIKTPDQLPEGEQLKFKLVLVNRPISLKGKVVYSDVRSGNERVSGIQFMKLSTHAHSMLRDYLADLDG